MSAQRSSRDDLSKDRHERLECIGFVWDPIEQQWEYGFNTLLQYIQDYGNSLVPAKFQTKDGYRLGGWVDTQRQSKSNLSYEKLERLNNVGFIWDAIAFQWEQSFKILSDYREEHGDCLVPGTYRAKHGFQLGAWVRTQRNNRNKMSKDRMDRLEGINFIWDPKDLLWRKGYEELLGFLKINGHCKVPYSYKTEHGFSLGNWVRKQRTQKNTLTNEYRHLLDNIKFIWEED